MRHVDTDPESGAEIWRLADDERPSDNIYGEQPYSSADGTRVALRHYAIDGGAGGLSFVDLRDGSVRVVLDEAPRFPAFHGWGENLYVQQEIGDRLVLRRAPYASGVLEDGVELPAAEGRFSYGTVSADEAHYAVNVHRDDTPCRLLHVDLADGSVRELARSNERYFKHEQFARDGSNRVMIQANSQDVSRVGLGAVGLDGELRWFAADQPHTPRPTGHEAWVGDTASIFFSTGWDEAARGNLWTVDLDDEAPRLVGTVRGGHISVSRCGRYGLIDNRAEGIPLYVGSLTGGRWARLCATGTVHDDQQWSHAHPYLTADNAWAVFTSNRDGHPQVYGTRLPAGMLESL